MSERSERMTAEPVYYYKCQEKAMAPGIGDGWPEVIAAPHTKNARLVRQEGDPAQLRTDLATANERVRVAEAKIVGLWKLLDDIDTLDDAAGDSDLSFRDHARPIQRRRFEIVSGEEFDTLSRLNARDGGGEGNDD